MIFLYISGHGAPDPQRPDDLYFLAHDTEMADLATTGVPMEMVGEAIQQTYAYNKVLISAVSPSAAPPRATGSDRAAPVPRPSAPREAVPAFERVSRNVIDSAFVEYQETSSGGFVAFTAGQHDQLSHAGEQYGGGHGVFTFYLLEGLKGWADEDHDRVVTLGEVMEYTRDRVRRETGNAQIPTISLTTYDRYWPMAAVIDR